MPDMFTTDIDNCIKAMEYFIIIEEEGLIQENAGDAKWHYLEPFRATLNNLRSLKGIYG